MKQKAEGKVKSGSLVVLKDGTNSIGTYLLLKYLILAFQLFMAYAVLKPLYHWDLLLFLLIAFVLALTTAPGEYTQSVLLLLLSMVILLPVAFRRTLPKKQKR